MSQWSQGQNIWGPGPPELAAASAVAEGRVAAAKVRGAFDHRLQGRALPHQAGGFQVFTTAWQLIWGHKEHTQQGSTKASYERRWCPLWSSSVRMEEAAGEIWSPDWGRPFTCCFTTCCPDIWASHCLLSKNKFIKLVPRKQDMFSILHLFLWNLRELVQETSATEEMAPSSSLFGSTVM